MTPFKEISTRLGPALLIALLAAAPVGAEEGVLRLPRQTPKVGYAPTEFSLSDTSGQTVNLSDFTGMVILLSFWSCYTDSCFSAVTVLQDFIKEFGTEKFVIPTVCSEVPDPLAADNYSGLLNRCSVGQVILVDKDREVQEIYNLKKMPAAFLIGSDYRIHEVVNNTSRLREPGFRKKIAELVEKSGEGEQPSRP
jgi:peroxiredoxin